MRKAKQKLTDAQLPVMAAIMAVSNMGQDHLFQRADRVLPVPRGEEQFKPKRAKELAHNERCLITLDSALLSIAGGIIETDEMYGWFIDEGKGWVKTLRKMSVEEIVTAWPDLYLYVNAITGQDWVSIAQPRLKELAALRAKRKRAVKPFKDAGDMI